MRRRNWHFRSDSCFLIFSLKSWSRASFFRFDRFKLFEVLGNWQIRSDLASNFVRVVKRRTKMIHVISFWFDVLQNWQLEPKMVRICNFRKTNAYQVTWKSPFSNRFCQIELKPPWHLTAFSRCERIYPVMILNNPIETVLCSLKTVCPLNCFTWSSK